MELKKIKFGWLKYIIYLVDSYQRCGIAKFSFSVKTYV